MEAMTVDRFNRMNDPLVHLVGRVRCLGDYDGEKICLWHGNVSECESLNGSPICPVCGSTVKRIGV